MLHSVLFSLGDWLGVAAPIESSHTEEQMTNHILHEPAARRIYADWESMK